MTDTELHALACLVSACTMEMEATNAGRASHGYAMAYDDSIKWPARDALEVELIRRNVIEA